MVVIEDGEDDRIGVIVGIEVAAHAAVWTGAYGKACACRKFATARDIPVGHVRDKLKSSILSVSVE